MILHTGLCPAGWILYKDSCYDFQNYCGLRREPVRTWTDARDWCESSGASLVTVTSQEENAFVNALRFESWIGAHQQNGQWVWTDGAEMSFTNWQTVNTKFAEGNCAMMQLYHGGKWGKRSCTTRADFICEKGIWNS